MRTTFSHSSGYPYHDLTGLEQFPTFAGSGLGRSQAAPVVGAGDVEQATGDIRAGTPILAWAMWKNSDDPVGSAGFRIARSDAGACIKAMAKSISEYELQADDNPVLLSMSEDPEAELARREANVRGAVKGFNIAWVICFLLSRPVASSTSLPSIKTCAPEGVETKAACCAHALVKIASSMMINNL